MSDWDNSTEGGDDTGNAHQGEGGRDASELYALGEAVANAARDQAIPLDPDHALTGRLTQVVPANQIPEEVYAAVAALLAFVRETEESAGD